MIDILNTKLCIITIQLLQYNVLCIIDSEVISSLLTTDLFFRNFQSEKRERERERERGESVREKDYEKEKGREKKRQQGHLPFYYYFLSINNYLPTPLLLLLLPPLPVDVTAERKICNTVAPSR